MTGLLRPTWFEIDLDAAVENLRTVRRLVGPTRKIFAVVKADGYGFGSLEMGRAFAENGADALGVAEEGEPAAQHPVQVLVTDSGDAPFDDCLLFREPSLPVSLGFDLRKLIWLRSSE